VKEKKETRGGNRPGAGAKPKYNEQTTTVAFRCPISKVGQIKDMVKSRMSEWLLIRDITPLTPFGEAINLLRDLADLQNGPPLERHRKEWEDTMDQVYGFLNKWKS